MNVLRVALPGYNALTDTNTDHFALYTDQDNVLIKEFARGSQTVSASEVQITHNLGYIPLFYVYAHRNHSGFDEWVTPLWPNFSVEYYIYADTTKLYLNNATGTDTILNYYIFYDRQVGSAAKTITEARQVLKVAKQGYNAETSKDPNEYLFHSNLNTFKIIQSVNTTVSVTGAGGNFTVAHGLSAPTAFEVYFQFPDNTVVNGAGYNAAKTQQVFGLAMDDTNIKFSVANSPNASYTFKIKYYIFETPLA